MPITTAIADSVVTPTELTGFTTRFTTYNTRIGTLRQRLAEAADAIKSAHVVLNAVRKSVLYEPFDSIPAGWSSTSNLSIVAVEGVDLTLIARTAGRGMRQKSGR